MKREEEINRIIERYGNCLYRTAYVMLGKTEDAQDVVQETLIRYLEKAPDFGDDEHEKAWLLKVTANLCRDVLRFNRRHKYISLEELTNVCAEPADRSLVQEVFSLPANYKIVLILFYIEGYRAKEIAHMIGLTEHAVKKRLQRGREALRQKIERQKKEGNDG